MPIERLQKILSRTGTASRRKAEELIRAGVVTVNGAVVTELGTKADLDTDHVKVDGKLLRAPKQLIYFMLNKPKGCVTTVSDPEGRKTVMDLLPGMKHRVYPVGRLDYDSEGLLLFTNDGDFTNLITHAKSQVQKTYVAKVTGHLNAEQEQQFRSGVPIHGKRTAPAGLKRIHNAENPWYEVKLIEGRQNQIKLMFRHFGLLVEKLKRVKVGSLELGNLKPGKHRLLTPLEVEGLYRHVRAPRLPAGDCEEGPSEKNRSEKESEAGMTIPELLKSSRTIAVVGLSSRRMRPSYGVSEYMQDQGYRIIPVNPGETMVLGEKAYATLEDVPEKIDIVNIFRRSEYVPELVDAAIRIGAKAVWMQEDVIHEEAAAKARAAGLEVVMDRCILKEHRRIVTS